MDTSSATVTGIEIAHILSSVAADMATIKDIESIRISNSSDNVLRGYGEAESMLCLGGVQRNGALEEPVICMFTMIVGTKEG